MGEVIWVELLSRHRDVIMRHRCTGDELRIGRAYDNDVVIDDPHTAPHHLRIYREGDGRLVAEDIGTTNGLYLDRGRRRVSRVVLDGETLLRLGHTCLRIRDAHHAVPPERAMPSATGDWIAIPALALATIGIDMVALWIADISEPMPSRYLWPPLILAVIALLWSGLWALLTRVFSNETRFRRNLLIALAGLFAYVVYSEFEKILAFAFSWPALASYDYVALWCILAAICFLHLRVISPARPWRKAAFVVPILAIAIAVQTVSQNENNVGLAQQGYLHQLLPPAFHLTRPSTETAFFSDLLDLKGRIDKDRTEGAAETAPPASLQPTNADR